MPLWHEKDEAWHAILPGVQRRILAHGPSAMLVLYRIAPGSTFPKHTHPHAQYGTVLEGGGRFTVGDHHVGAFFQERPSGRVPDPLACPRYEGPRPGEAEIEPHRAAPTIPVLGNRPTDVIR